MPKVSLTVSNKQADQKKWHDGRAKLKELEPNQAMLVENHSGEGKWVPGVVLEKLGPTLY